MKKLLLLLCVFVLQLHLCAFAQVEINHELERELAKQLIENYKNGIPETRLKVDLENVSVMRIYGYVYSVLPERLDVVSNTENQEIWLRMRSNQNHKHSMEMAHEINKTILNENMTELEKIIAIHDYIVLHTEFDSEIAKTAKTINDENIYAFCADGVFTKKKAVCSGYAAAFQMMCQDVEIPCFTINSNIKNHTWNVVYYDGAWRFIDVSSESKVKYGVNMLSTYHYFMLNENELPQKTHQLDELSEKTLSIKEYIAFYNQYANKQHNTDAKSVSVDLIKELAK